jgi:RNA polymerase sigma factor (sigma-70 family)
MLKLLKSASPEDLFVQRYDQLLGWALSLTNHNQEQAEDLVHDAFIQFTHRRGDLAAIENTDAYLNRMLRNMYLSQVRRAGLIQDSRFSIADFDSIEMGLRSFRASDPREHLDLQDELRQICQYACLRKQTSKVGSVFILRFFHGYYASEIAQVLSSTRMAVDRYLQISRREAKSYLTDPTSLKFMSETRSANPPALGCARTTPELLNELREAIFAARDGDCFSKAELKERYRRKPPIDGSLLAHLVSCSLCLDAVNQLLELPPLAERSSDDRLGRDVPPGKSGGGGAGGTGASVVESKKKYQRRVKEVMEHRPQELRVAVNGFVLGAQQVNSELSKLALTANVDEPIGFVEVFSEQGVRLLFFDVDQPTDGSIEQSAGVDFDCGRALDLSLSFRGPWPAVNLAYHDPTFDAVESYVDGFEVDIESLGHEVSTGSGSDRVGVQSPTSHAQRREISPTVRQGFGRALIAKVRATFGKLVTNRKDLGPWSWNFGQLFRAGAVTALFGLILIAVLMIIYRQPSKPTISAADLLQRAAASEDALASNRDQVLHRTINLEEKSAGKLTASQRIEVWHSAEKGITARRLYDDRGALIAGDWRRADGVQTIYHHGKRPELQLVPEKRDKAPINFDNVWQLDPTAKEFALLTANGPHAEVKETGSTYIINYSNVADENLTGLVKATLVLGRTDLHATEQALVVKQADQFREFRFIETSFERRAPNSVAPAVFEPELELLSSNKLETPNSKPETAALVPSPVIATASLEVEVIDLLNNAGAFMGEQISVQRTAEGKLQVNALVETAQRKTELLNALARVKTNPAVRMNIETVAEAQAREARKKTKQQAPGEVTVNRFEATEDTSPVYSDLRLKFSDQEARAFADRILRRSQQARRHALAMKQLSERFSITDLQTLNATERARWIGLIRGHASKFLSETDALRRELQTVFSDLAGGRAGSSLDNDKEIQSAVRRLYDLSVACDEDLRGSFAVFTNAAGSAEVKTAKFWRALNNAAALAQSLQSAR